MHAVLSHYRILERIGEGGMGVVYRAHDERLERDVALKVLPAGALGDEAARKRFRKEALALSKLNHPNIATVHDFDTQEETDFLVEELIPGLSLREMLMSGPLPERDIIHLGSQLCEGLSAAHEQGIIHRDLKPANVRVTPDTRVKILDFGLAKVLRSTLVGSDMDRTASLTEAQTVSGTLPYMAPEQLLNEKLDTRTDIWAVGCVLYEMVTGRRPFLGSGPALTESILHRPAASPSKLSHNVAPGLEAIILKCLEKDPALRYASARDIAVDLRRLSLNTAAAVHGPSRRLPRVRLAVGALVLIAFIGTGLWLAFRSRGTNAADIRSLAVLPLANLSGDPQQEYFSDGMTEALIANLSRISALKVISRTSVMQYKGARKTLPQIARELGVDGVVEGSVVRAGGRVRITAQLIHAASDRHVWAETYDRDLTDVLDLQSEVARKIAAEINVKLTPNEQALLSTAHAVNPRAHEAYLKGQYELSKFTPDSVRKAINYYTEAVKQDPGFAAAHAGLAHAYFFLAQPMGQPMPRELFAQGQTSGQKAIALEERNAEAHSALADIALFGNWDWTTAEREHRRAIELDPNSAMAHSTYAIFLSTTGRHAEAATEIARAIGLDPLDLRLKALAGEVAYMAGDYDRAMRELNDVLELDPRYHRALVILGLVYEAKRMVPEAISSYEKAGATAADVAAARKVYAEHGVQGYFQWCLDDLKRYPRPSAKMAGFSARLGRKDEAFRHLEQAYREHDGELVFLKVEGRYEALRSDPRFQDLLRRIGIPP